MHSEIHSRKDEAGVQAVLEYAKLQLDAAKDALVHASNEGIAHEQGKARTYEQLIRVIESAPIEM